MISTGINALDEMLGGGIPSRSRVLYSMEPGVNGQYFMISTLTAALKKGLNCLVIMPNTTIDAFRHDALAMHMDKKILCSDRLKYIDAIDCERIHKGASSPESKARDWKARIQRVGLDHRIDVIFVYFDLLYEEFGLKTGICILEEALKDKKTTLILEHLNLEGAPLVDRFISDHAFDLVLTIRLSSHPLPPFSYFTLFHTSWAPTPVRSIPFSIHEGMVVPYIPKIVVIGPEKSGKTTFIAHASVAETASAAPAPKEESAAAGMDFGRMQWKNFDIILYGIPGVTESEIQILPTLRHAMGVVIVIDAGDPDRLRQGNALAQMVAKQRIPFVIAANRKSVTPLLSEKEIRTSLALPREIPLYFISANNRDDVRHVLESLVDYITRMYS